MRRYPQLRFLSMIQFIKLKFLIQPSTPQWHVHPYATTHLTPDTSISPISVEKLLESRGEAVKKIYNKTNIQTL